MKYHVIQHWDPERFLTIDGRTVEVPAVVEDDDGIRILVVADYSVRRFLWEEADRQRVAAVALVDPTDDTWKAQSADVFMATRTVNAHTEALDIDTDALTAFTDPPNYRTIVEREREAAVPKRIYTGHFVQLHAHSEYSALDGLSTLDEMVAVAVAHDVPAVCLTDHGICAGHPELSKMAHKAGLIPIFGIEANLTGNRLLRGSSEDKEGPLSSKHILGDYYHLILWAETDEGLHNLWAMSTEANLTGFYGRPRLDWDVLERHADGIMCSTGCLRGPLSRPLVNGHDDLARTHLGRLQSIFDQRLWIELHANVMPDQIVVNQALVELAHDYSLPTVAVTDSHYACADDKHTHQVWISSQIHKSVTDDAVLFQGNQDYHLLSEAEVRHNLGYLPAPVVDEAVSQTIDIAHRCKADIRAKRSMPVYSRKGGPAADLKRAVDLGVAAWPQRVLERGVRLGYGTEEQYLARFEREARLLTDKKYWGYFLVVWEQTDFAKRNRVLVGPGRGSGAGSLIAYLLRITEIDPIEADLLFERFLTEGRDSPPDFDMDYPSSKRDLIQDHVVDRWGYESTLRVGTHTRLRNKGAVRDMASALKGTIDIHWPDIEAVSKIIDEAEADTAGLGMDWNEMWSTLGDIPASNGNPLTLNKARAKYPELFRLADRVVGRLKTYGRHAAGMVISTDSSLLSQLPLRTTATSGQPISEFDMKALELLGLLKFDILTLRTLDTLQSCLDLIAEHYGVVIDPSAWIEEYTDPQVWDELCDGNTLGVFQIETIAGTRLTAEFKPRSIADLADVIALNRPGPQRSGLAAAYLRRRANKEAVTIIDPRLTEILRPTQGVIIYQEQVMSVCQVLGGYTLAEADDVRRMLGKKEVEKVAEAGREFVARCVANGGTEDAAVKLWVQLGEFAKYCLSGDTVISLAGGGRQVVTIADLYHRLHTPLRDPVPGRTKTGEEFRGPCDCCGATESPHWMRGFCNACYVWRRKFDDPNRGVHALAVYADGRIRPARILDVIDNGDADVWRVVLADGRSITATPNHQHLTGDGFRRVDELHIGDRLLIDGGYEPHRYDPAEYRTTIGERQMVGAVAGHYGQGNYGFIDGGFTRLQEWTRTAAPFCEDCGHDGTVRRLERAHLDGNRTNNDPANLRMLCVSCHKRFDYANNNRRRRWQKGHLAVAVPIVSIERVGVERTYDVVMDQPHNFVANGIVTSNSFNKSHAWGYAMISHWCAWFKVHYPSMFLTALLSTIDKGRIPEFVPEARRMGYQVRPPDVNASGRGFRPDGGLAVRYGLDAVKGIGDTVDRITANQPYTSVEDFQQRSGVDRGITRILANVGAFDTLEPNRRALEERLGWFDRKEDKQCIHKDRNVIGPNGLPCTFDWSSEPVEFTKTGKAKKPKPLPLQCTVRCRHHTPPVAPNFETVSPYTDDDIRERERELLGFYLSSTPFDRIDAEHLALCSTGAEVNEGRLGEYLVAAIVNRVKAHTDKRGNKMAFLSLDAQGHAVEVAALSDTWARHYRDITKDGLCLALIVKESRGNQLKRFIPL